MMLSMNQAERYTGMNKHKILGLAKEGKLSGAVRGEGRTAKWSIPQEALDPYRTERGRELVTVRTDLAFPGQQMYTVSELCDLTGRSQGLITRHINQGTVKATRVNHDSGKGYHFLIPESEIAVLNALVQRPTGPRGPYHTKRSRELDTDAIGEALRQAGERQRAATRGQMLPSTELAKELGVHISTLYGWEARGLIKGERVQVSENRKLWMFDAAQARAYAKEREDAGHGLRVPKLSLRKPHTVKPVFTPTPIAPNGLLTQKLLDLAELIRNNPMLSVETCEVVIKLKG
jgi:DNA-binding transcriptional MerR regulator